MASLVGRAGIPPQPSTGFLRKCAKEQEKLRTKLHRQLQHDMLQLLDEGYFSDITIKSSGIPTPLAVKIHQAILKVRVPAFLCEVSQSLQQSQTSNSGFNSYLSNVELLSFLRKVYSEDDIRRHECEAVRLNKKYSEEGKLIELVSSTQETSTTEIEEQESLQTSGGYLSSNGDIYLTPISSPLSPEKKVIRVPEEVLEITVTEEESEKDSYNVSSFRDLKLVMKTKDNNKLVTECDVNVKSEERNDQLIALQNSSQNLLSTEVSSSKICLETDFQGSSPSSKEKESVISLPKNKQGLKFEKMDLPRSDTFEISSSLLQENSQDIVLKEKAEVTRLQEIIIPKTDKKKESFFLHNKASILKDKEEKSEPPIITSHVQTLSTYHLDGSMTDSGFMSQSHSLMSDTEFSSPLMCSMMNCSSVKSSTGEKVLENIAENNQLSSSVCSGSLFPLYVDMNSVIPEENIKTAVEKKQQDPYLCTDSTGTLHDDTQAAYSSKPHVISLETLEQSSCSERNKGNSCYMYVDLDSIKPEESERLQTSQQKVKEKKHPMSVSMFVEMNGKINDSVRSAQEMYTSLIEIGTEKLKNSKVQDMTDSSTQIINPESSGHQEKNVPLRMVQQEEFLEHNNSVEEIAKQIKGIEAKSVDGVADSSYQVCSEEGLLPMSPIMKRKVVKQELLRSPPEDIAVKESIKPQDLNALAFPLNVSIQTLRSISKDSLEETFGQDIDPDKTELLYSYKEDIVTSEEQQIDATVYSIQQKAERYPLKIFNSPEETTHLDDKVPISEKNQPKLEDSTIIKTCITNIDSKKPSTSIVEQLSMSEKTTPIKTKNSELKSYEEVSSGTELDELDRGNEEVIFTPTVKHSRITPVLGHSSVEKMLVRNSKSKSQVSLNDSNEQDTNELKEKVEIVTEIALENQQKLNESMKQLVSPPPQPPNFKTLKRVHSHQIKPALSRMHREFEQSPEKIERPRITEKQLNVEKQFESGKKQKVYQNLEYRKENVHNSEISQFLSPFPPPSSCDLEDDSETIYSEVSDISSSILGPVSFNTLLDRASQHGRNSPEGSTSNKFHEACSKLGEDLLRMFLEEINADVIIRLPERDIKAHKCILVSRCKYFEAMLRGNWSENTDDIIKMQGYSYSAVHFALCHIYSGDINLPKGANIAELAQLSDMLGLDSLKEVVIFHLKMNYCHFFHRPCNQCINGVVECLSLTKSCGLQELQNKSIRWMGKYFTRIWTHKAFAMLSNEFQEKCYQSALQNLTVETSVEMLLSCDRLLASLPRIKWAEPVYGLVTRLIQNCIHFIAVKFDKVVTSDGFLALGKGQSWNVTAIEDNILSAVEQLTPDIACRTYVQLGQLLPMAETQGSQELGDWTENFLELLHRLQRQSERYLIHHANHVIHCTSWNLLAPEVQKKIRDSAVIIFEFEKPTAPPPRLSSLQKKVKKNQEDYILDSESKCATFPIKNKNSKLNSESKQGKKQSHGQEVTVASGKKSDDKINQNCSQKISVKTIPGNSTCKCATAPSSISQEVTKVQKKNKDEDSGTSPDVSITTSSKSVEACDLCSDNHSDPTMSDKSRKSRERNESLKVNPEVHPKSKSNVTSPVKDSSFIKSHKVNDDKQMSSHDQQAKVRSTSLSQFPTKTEGTSSLPGVKNSQVAKVSPFTVKSDIIPQSSDSCDKTFLSEARSIEVLTKSISPVSSDEFGSGEINKDLMSEIDVESSLVSHCLQEAELLEQKLQRKLQNQQNSLGHDKTRKRSERPIINVDAPASSQRHPTKPQRRAPVKASGELSNRRSLSSAVGATARSKSVVPHTPRTELQRKKSLSSRISRSTERYIAHSFEHGRSVGPLHHSPSSSRITSSSGSGLHCKTVSRENIRHSSSVSK
ncbi:uncharacterized protein LOC143252213 [Tachypleus tridentatus]|uniref:uncharacterized protein LOC143252213 n=1 Tax=Tachypleus tridentatus TaxID=6853 RepID=UPI003FD38FD7